MRRRGVDIERDYQMYTEVTGFRPVSEWDDAELAHGRPRAKDGTFRGPTPTWVTPMVLAEARKRWQGKTSGALAQYTLAAVATLRKLMEDPETDARTRADVAKFIYEQVNGKATVKVDMDSSDLVRSFIAGALVLDDGQPAHPVIDGQFEDEDDDWTDDEDDEDLPPVRKVRIDPRAR